MKIGEGKNNENTVKYYEYFDNEIVMELYDESLTNLIIKRQKYFSIEEIYNIIK